MAAAALVLLIAGILWLNIRKQPATNREIAKQGIPVKKNPLAGHTNAPSAKTTEPMPHPTTDVLQPGETLEVIKDKKEDNNTHPAHSRNAAGEDQKLLTVKSKQQKAGQDKPEILKEGKEMKSSSIALTNKKSMITRETAITAHLKCYYANEKIKKQLNYNFTPVEKVIEETAKIFLLQL